MGVNGGAQGPHLEDVQLIIVDSPHVAGPLVDALDVADVGAWMWVEGERALYFSPRVLALLGLPLQPIGDLLARFETGVHPDDRPALDALLRRSVATGPFEYRYRFTPPNGPLRWIENRGRVERDAAGAVVRVGGALRDITHEVGREQERREADARLDALVNAMPFSVWGRGGPGLAVTHQNAASLALWGDLRGSALSEAPPETRCAWQGFVADAMTGQVVRARSEHVLRGERRVLQNIVAPVIVEDRVAGVVGVEIDVTDEDRARRFESLLGEISAEFASRATDDLDSALTGALEKIGQFLGASFSVLCDVDEHQLRLTHWWVSPLTGEEAPATREFDCEPLRGLLDQLASNQPVVVHSRDELPESSPERAWLTERGIHSFAMVPTRQTDGSLVVLALIGGRHEVADWAPDTAVLLRLAATLLGSVLARIRAEQQQRAAERRLQEAQKLDSLGILAGGIAHEFNNLLTAILGNASLMRAELGARAGSPLEQIDTAARRAAELCRQMLAYAGRGRFALRLVDLNELVRGTQALLSVTVPRHCTLALDLADQLPPVLADEAQIRQLLMNLVINAAEALAERTSGTITIATSAGSRSARELARTVFSPQLPDGEYVSLSVSDTGEGMPPDTIARIFDPFFSTKFTGRGLGLSAVVGIVRSHKGALRVDSRPGVGSTFELMLPAFEGQLLPAPVDAGAGPTTGEAGWRTTGVILVVDDEVGVRNLARSVLERVGMTVLVAENGRRGVEVFRERAREVRAVMVDLTMPELDGRQALEEMRRLRPDVPAILMSGYALHDLPPGSFEFLQKPFTPAGLRAVLRRALGE